MPPFVKDYPSMLFLGPQPPSMSENPSGDTLKTGLTLLLGRSIFRNVGRSKEKIPRVVLTKGLRV